MGKISDALEKADRKVKPGEVVPREITPKEKSDPADNTVVSLSSAIKASRKANLDERLITYWAPQSVEAELFKVLRTNLLFPNEGKPPRVILVTSASEGEGKSFISSNLAVIIAQGIEEHVLLIDSDIRRPVMHKYFGLDKVGGLSEYLTRQDDISKLMYKTVIPKLSIIPGGKPPLNPAELVTSKKMKALLEEVKERYDDRYTIIDSPPMSIAAETSAIAKYVDGIIMVVRAGVTPRKEVSDAIEQLGREKILGIVLNDSEQSLKKYYGYKKYKIGK
jgi:protein-tyrosine kinase